jgi:hypothetical protein
LWPPVPADPWLIWPGLALARAIRPFTSFTGFAGQAYACAGPGSAPHTAAARQNAGSAARAGIIRGW